MDEAPGADEKFRNDARGAIAVRDQAQQEEERASRDDENPSRAVPALAMWGSATIVDASAGTPENRWLRTGDLGFISDDELFIVGRER